MNPDLLVPAALLAGFARIWLLFRPDPARKRAIEQAVLRGARIVDVRPAAAFLQQHVQGAESIPLDALDDTPLAEGPQRMVVYGASAEESAEAARILRARGVARVVDAGPMSHWPIPQPG